MEDHEAIRQVRLLGTIVVFINFLRAKKYLKKNKKKKVKKNHSHSTALSARNRIVIDRQALATGARDVLAVKPLRYCSHVNRILMYTVFTLCC